MPSSSVFSAHTFNRCSPKEQARVVHLALANLDVDPKFAEKCYGIFSNMHPYATQAQIQIMRDFLMNFGDENCYYVSFLGLRIQNDDDTYMPFFDHTKRPGSHFELHH